MSPKTLPTIWTACRSSLELERWLHGELGEDEAASLRAHVEGCAACTPAVAALRLSQAEELPPLRAMATGAAPRANLRLVRDGETAPANANQSSHLEAPARRAAIREETAQMPARRAGSRWRGAVALATGAAAAALVLMVLRPAHVEDGERSKGSGLALGMYVQHGESVRRAGPGEEVAPGDAVRFSLRAPSSGYAAVLSRDGQGHASIYFPGAVSEAARAAWIDASANGEIALPLSTRLDGTLGEEQLVGIVCKSASLLEPVRASLEHGALQLPDGCQATQWSFVKR